MVACKSEPLDVDPCGIWPDDISMCHAIPLIESNPEYDRRLEPGDICVGPDGYARIQKRYRKIMEQCGNKCN